MINVGMYVVEPTIALRDRSITKNYGNVMTCRQSQWHHKYKLAVFIIFSCWGEQNNSTGELISCRLRRVFFLHKKTTWLNVVAIEIHTKIIQTMAALNTIIIQLEATYRLLGLWPKNCNHNFWTNMCEIIHWCTRCDITICSRRSRELMVVSHRASSVYYLS